MPRWFFFSFLLMISEISIGSSDLYRFNPKANNCEPVLNGQSLKSRPSALVRDFPHISSDFLERNPACANAPTCLSYDRLQRMIQRGDLPKGVYAHQFLQSEFREKAAKACLEHETANFQSVVEVIEALGGRHATHPIETRKAYQLVAKTKERVQEAFQLSELAIEGLKQCFRIDAEARNEKAGYQDKLRQNSFWRQNCQPIQDPDRGEMAYFQNQLARMRLALHGLHLLEPSKDGQLTHKKGGVFGQFQSSIYDGTPDSVSPLTAEEKNNFQTYIQKLKKDHPGEDIGTLLKMDYFQSVSDNPLVLYFPSDKISSGEIADALEKHQGKQKTLWNLEISDVDYLQFATALEQTMKEPPFAPDEQGDLCVLADFMLQSQAQHRNTPQHLLAGMMGPPILASMIRAGVVLNRAGQSAGAITGYLLKKFPGLLLLSSGRLGTAVSSWQIGKSLLAYEEARNRCTRISHEGNGLCDFNSLQKRQSEAAIGFGMMLFFGAGVPLAQKLRQAGSR